MRRKRLRGKKADVSQEQILDCLDAIAVFKGYPDKFEAFKAVTGASTFFARWAVFRGEVLKEHWELLDEAERCLC